MQFPPFPHYLVPSRSKYSPQHHVLKHPQLPFLPQCQRPSFTPIRNNRQNYSFNRLVGVKAAENWTIFSEISYDMNLNYHLLYGSCFICHRYGLDFLNYLPHICLEREAVDFCEKLVIFCQILGLDSQERVFVTSSPFNYGVNYPHP